MPAFGAEDTDESLRAARAAVESDAADFVDGFLGDQKQAAHGSFRGDGKIGERDEPVDALKLDCGNDGDVDVAGAERFGTLRRNGEGKLIFAAKRAVREAADKRGGVQVLDDGDAERVHSISVLRKTCLV